MKVYARDVVQVGTKVVNGKQLPLCTMTLVGNGECSAAKPQFFNDGVFENKAIAQGSAYCNTKTFGTILYDEENNTWGA